MKVYVVFDDPIEDESEIYGVYETMEQAIKRTEQLAVDPEQWGAAADIYNKYHYIIKEIEFGSNK